MSEPKLAYRYNKSKNREGAFFPGVPLDDLTQEQFRALPKHLQQQVKDSDFYEEPAPEVQEASVQAEEPRPATTEKETARKSGTSK